MSVAFRAAALTKCLFSLRGEEEGPTESCLDDAFVNKNPECPGFLFFCFAPPCLCVCAKRLVEGTVRVRLTSEPAWVPIV